MKKKFYDNYKRKLGVGVEAPGRGFHSGSYHRNFEGYSEYECVDAKGKTRIKRVYTGEWYTQSLEKRQRVFLRVSLGLLWAAALALFILCATRRTSSNNCWYVAIAQFAAIAGMLWTASGLGCYYIAPVRMTVGDWRASSQRMQKGSICAAIAFGLSAFTTLMNLFITSEDFIVKLLCAGGFLVCGAIMLFFDRLEANVPYDKTQSEEIAPPSAARID